MKLFSALTSLTLLLTSWSCSSPATNQRGSSFELPPLLAPLPSMKAGETASFSYKLQDDLSVNKWELVFIPSGPTITGTFKENIVPEGYPYTETTLTIKVSANAKPGEYRFKVDVFVLDKNNVRIKRIDSDGKQVDVIDRWRSTTSAITVRP